MNKLEYLNTIAKDNRTTKPRRTGRSGSLIAKIAIGGVVLFLLLLVLGQVLRNGNSKSIALTKQLYNRTITLSETTTGYSKLLKSSKLRAINLSLSTVLTDATAKLNNYLTENNIDPELNSKTLKDETNLFTNLDYTLTNARLNGILDRIYANEIQLQVSLLLSLVSQNLARTKDSDLTSILEAINSNLTFIETELKTYSSPSD